MMQEYDLSGTGTLSVPAEATMQPSEQILQNILNFARCYQNIEAEGLHMKVFLN